MRLTKKKTKAKLNNLGMSLVEVIISITILSIVVVPTLYAMTTAMAYNGKARRRQEVTLTAESMLEAFKGYDLATLQDMFTHNGQTSDGSNRVIYQQPEGAGAAYSYVWHAADETDPDDYFVFYIQGLSTDTGKLYDVEMKAQPTVKSTLLAMNSMAAADINVKCDRSWNTNVQTNAQNDFMSAASHISELKTYLDDSVKSDEFPDDKACKADGNELSEADLSTELNNEDYIIIDERIMEFQITSSGVTSIVRYRYHLANVPYYKPVHKVGKTEVEYELQHLGRFPESGYYEFEQARSDTNGNSGNIYLYYYPNYAQKDNILINNTTGNGVTCYLFKQRPSNKSEAWTATHEAAYQVAVRKSGGAVTLYHNLEQNIGKKGMAVGSWSVEAGFANGTDSKGEKFVNADTTVSAPEVFLKDMDTVYDLTLTIKESGTDVVAASIKGTMNEK